MPGLDLNLLRKTVNPFSDAALTAVCSGFQTPKNPTLRESFGSHGSGKTIGTAKRGPAEASPLMRWK